MVEPSTVERPASPTTVEADVWQPLRGPFTRWPNAADFLIAVFALIMTLAIWSLESDDDVLALHSFAAVATFLSAFVGNFALLWRRTHAWQVHGVVLAAAACVLALGVHGGVFALAFSLYSLGRFEPDRRASVVGVVLALVFIVVDLVILGSLNVGDTLVVGLTLGLWYFGRRLRFREEYLRLLEERAEHLERERSVESERAMAAERTRIAREMHDVVAHQVSLMTVQAGAAKTVSASDPQAANEAMAAVEEAGRTALTQMRHLLGVLRPASGEQALVPQPCIQDLPTLIEQVREAGLQVNLTTTGTHHTLPQRLELTVYRVVQEALTNVIKHAGAGVSVQIDIDIGDQSVVLNVKDDGRGGDVHGPGGHGLIGMRERVELLHGVFSAGSASDEGFEINAIIPRSMRKP
ncbi:MAG: sensor histidine kinase [Gammaproteobacteria bacterium]